MVARVINDPSALGWEYDPATGRWTWGGSSGSGGGGGGGSFPEAPVDGKQYGRQNAGWTEVVHTGGGGGGYDDTQIKADLAQETQDRIDGDATLQGQIDNLSGGANAYGQWNLQANGQSPFAVVSDSYVNFEGSGGISVTRAGGYITIDGSALGGGAPIDADNYQYWRYQVNGTGTTNVMSMNTINFRAGSNVTLTKLSDGIEISATGGGGGSVDLTGYATEAWVSSNYQPKGSYISTESDPTVPVWVKSITQNDINNWNSSVGGGNPFPWTGLIAEFISSNNGSNIKITSGGSRGPEILFANTAGGATSKSLRASGGNLEVVNSAYNNVIWSVSDAGVCTATDFVATSDRNKKDHIETAPTGVIEKLRGVTFQWKDTGKESAGVIAQELQDAGLGHLVHEGDDGLSVAYAGLTAYLIEEIKDLKAQVEALK